MQHLAHVRFAVWDSNQIDTPPVNPTYFQKPGYRSISHDAPAMQHPVHVTTHCYRLSKHCNIWPTYDSQYGLATKPTPPPVNLTYCQNWDIDLPTTTDLGFPQRLSSCIQRLDRLQLPATFVHLHSTTQPTATRIKHPAVSLRLDWSQLSTTIIQPHLRLDHTSCRHRPSSWRPNTTATYFTHTFVIPTINRHFCNICYLAFVFLHCLWLSQLARIKLKIICGVDMLIGSVTHSLMVPDIS